MCNLLIVQHLRLLTSFLFWGYCILPWLGINGIEIALYVIGI